MVGRRRLDEQKVPPTRTGADYNNGREVGQKRSVPHSRSLESAGSEDSSSSGGDSPPLAP